MSQKLMIPKFQSEAEEAEWWDQHRAETAQWMEEAVTAGETTTLSAILERARERSGGASTVTIRVDPPDAERARALAAQKGVPCETYLKTLLHDALDRDERCR
jgi:predicted DNA binding CopG/RHH family protein